MITLNPLVISYHEINSESPNVRKFSITDRIHFLPFNLWPSSVVYTAEFTDTENGIDVLTNAPMGFEGRSIWSVEGTTVEGGQVGNVGRREKNLVLVEYSTMRCFALFAPFVGLTMKSSHEKMHNILLRKLE